MIKFTPIIDGLLKDATMVKKPDIGLVNSASDYSYQSAIYTGPGWRVIGDAGGKLLAVPFPERRITRDFWQPPSTPSSRLVSTWTLPVVLPLRPASALSARARPTSVSIHSFHDQRILSQAQDGPGQPRLGHGHDVKATWSSRSRDLSIYSFIIACNNIFIE